MGDLELINRLIIEKELELKALRLLARQHDPERELFEHEPPQQHVIGLKCKCGEPVKVLRDYKGKGVDYYCCDRPKATGCDFWRRADDYQVAGGYK